MGIKRGHASSRSQLIYPHRSNGYVRPDKAGNSCWKIRATLEFFSPIIIKTLLHVLYNFGNLVLSTLEMPDTRTGALDISTPR
jgi:hypothetical protein